MFRQLDECWFEFNQLGLAGIQFTMICSAHRSWWTSSLSWEQLEVSLIQLDGVLWFGSVWTSPGRLLGEPMVWVQDGSTKLVLGLGQGVGKLPECELRLSDRFVKGRKGEKPPMGGYGTVLGRRDVIFGNCSPRRLGTV